MSKLIKFNDNLNIKDTIHHSFKPNSMFRTKVIAGHDLKKDKNGVSQLGEVLFEKENMTVLGGALFTLGKVFGVEPPITIDYLNTFMNIANDGVPINESFPKENVVCLFGIGIGGCGDSLTSVKDVKIYEREIFDMIPFRITDEPLLAEEQDKYWFRQLREDGKTAYYLKKFEAVPEIKVLWKDSENDEDGTEVENGVHNTTRTEPIESFVEIILNINKKDVREFFELNGNIEMSRVNSLGLFTGIQGTLADNSIDYKQVQLFSKLNFYNEMLNLAKDLTFIYRIYAS